MSMGGIGIGFGVPPRINPPQGILGMTPPPPGMMGMTPNLGMMNPTLGLNSNMPPNMPPNMNLGINPPNNRMPPQNFRPL
jgi:hypothetical protein